MRVIGRAERVPSQQPQADGLRRAAVHQAAGRALARVSSTGIVKGVYRFKTHAEADAQVNEALARVMAANALRQKKLGG
jgi:hypothetical protein